MDRLYYDSSVLKTVKSFSTENIETGKSGDVSRYFEKVAKLVPSEILAAYIALIGLVPAIQLPVDKVLMYQILTAFCLVLTPIYFIYMGDKERPKMVHTVLSTLAFVVWAYSVAGDRVVSSWHDDSLASMALIIFSLVSGLVPLKK